MRHVVREGVVSSVNVQEHTARVIFEDADGVVSAELPVLVMYAGQNKVYALPDVGDSVVVLMLENNGQSGEGGFIIGCRYHEQLKPVGKSQEETRLDFGDNAYISYDRAAHEFRIQFSDGASIIHRRDGDLVISNKGNIIMDGRQIKLN